MSDLVRLEVEDGIGTIRLDRPPMNALNAEIQHGLIAACREAAERRDVSAVIVWGGEKVFAAGADIKEMETMSYTDMVDHSALLQDFTRVAGPPAQADRRRHHRLRPRRRLRGRPRVRLPHRGRRRPARAARDPARHHPRCRRHPAPRPARRAVEGQGPRVLRPVRHGRRGARDRARRCRGARRRGLRHRPLDDGVATSAARPTRCARPRRPSTVASRSTSSRAWRSSGRCSPAPFATKDQAIGMRHFVEKGKGPAPFEGA